jgi:uncharacterized protein YndB with AHSA1/START domain
MTIEFTISTTIKTSPHTLYAAWMSSKGHTRMTGSPAVIQDKVGTSFTAWDGYIEGKNLELVRDQRIVQSWRTVEFLPEEADSILEITLAATQEGTRLKLHHSNLPPHGAQYEQGWEESYFQPMREYFETI